MPEVQPNPLIDVLNHIHDAINEAELTDSYNFYQGIMNGLKAGVAMAQNPNLIPGEADDFFSDHSTPADGLEAESQFQRGKFVGAIAAQPVYASFLKNESDGSE